MSGTRHRIWVAAALLSAALTSGCLEGSVKYQPPILPFEIGINSDGEVSLTRQWSYVTVLGEITLEGGASKELRSDEESTVLILRHLVNNVAVDQPYKIKTKQPLTVRADVPVEVSISPEQVFVDASIGGVGTVTVGPADKVGPPPTLQERLQAFDDAIYAADQRNDYDYLIDRLDPVSFQYFTREQCVNFLKLASVGTQKTRIESILGPQPATLTWEKDGESKSITVDGVYQVTVVVPETQERAIEWTGQENGRLTYIPRSGCGAFAKTD